MYRNSQLHEELFTAILEELDAIAPIKRLNLFFLVDCLLKDRERFKFDGYFTLIVSYARDVIDLVLDITRVNGKAKVGAPMNSYAVVKALQVWTKKQVITEQKLEKIKTLVNAKTTKYPFSKDTIWRRMEEDRDRQKKAREDSWSQIKSENGPDQEFLNAWANAKPLTSSDLANFETMYFKYQLS